MQWYICYTKPFHMKLFTITFALVYCLAMPCIAQQTDSTRQQPTISIAQPLGATTLKSKEMNTGNFTSPWQLIQGRAAGLTVARAGDNPTEAFQVRIRGLNTFLGNTQPLVVVDGVPGVDITLIDVSDIATMTVLRDAASCARYGLRGSAGVVEITTKTGEPDGLRVNYQAHLAIDQSSKEYTVTNAKEFIQLGGVDESGGKGVDTDWQSLVRRTGISHGHALSMSGGLGGGQYRIGLHYRSAQGILRNNGLQQQGANLAWTQNILHNRVKISANGQLMQRQFDYGMPDAFRYALTYNPTQTVRSSDPKYDRFGGYTGIDAFQYFNPVALIEQVNRVGQATRVGCNLRAEADVWAGIKASILVAQSHQDLNKGTFNPTNGPYQQIYNTRKEYTKSNSRFIEAALQQERTLGNGIMMHWKTGYDWQSIESDQTDTTAFSTFQLAFGSKPSDYRNTIFLNPDLNLWRSGFNLAGRETNQFIGIFGRITLDYRTKLGVQAGFRREGSNRLGREAQWGNFPHMVAYADLAKFVKLPVFNQLQLRLGYGISGQQPHSKGASRFRWNQNGQTFYYNGAYVNTVAPFQNPNAGLRHEKNTEINVGLQTALMSRKVTVGFDYFRSTATDLIILGTVSEPVAYSGIVYQNLAELGTIGMEVVLGMQEIKPGKHLEYQNDLVLSRAITTVNATSGNKPIEVSYVGAPGFCCVSFQEAQVGQQVGTFTGLVRNEIDANGIVTYVDKDKNGVVDHHSADAVNFGSAQPKWQFGWHNRLIYKRLSLNFILRGVRGHLVANETRLHYETGSSLKWTAQNAIRTTYFDPKQKVPVHAFDNTYAENASFLRLQNLEVSYQLPSIAHVRSARVFLGGQNLLTLTKYTGLDPEYRLTDAGDTDIFFNGRPLQPLAPGIDRRDGYGVSRTWLVGLRFGF